MPLKIYNLFLLLCILEQNCTLGATIYFERFDVLGQGYVGVIDSPPVGNFESVSWVIDAVNCNLQNETDYIRTVATSGGRLEACDINGEAIWFSPWVTTQNWRNMRLSFLSKEIGGGANEKTKQLRVFVKNAQSELIAISDHRGNWGTHVIKKAVDVADSIQIVAYFINHYAGDKVILDDVELEGEYVVSGHDYDSSISLVNGDLTQEITSISNSREFSFPILSLRVTDAGSGDNYSTYPQKLVFVKGDHSSNLSIIDSLFVTINDDWFIPDSLAISDEQLEMFYKNRQIDIPSGHSVELTIFGTLKKSGVGDKDSLQLVIPQEMHNWCADVLGSSFITKFEEKIASSKISIDVIGNKLKLRDWFLWFLVGADLSLSNYLVDEWGQRDLDPRNLELSINQNPINLSSYDNGIYFWNVNVDDRDSLLFEFKLDNDRFFNEKKAVKKDVKQLFFEDFESSEWEYFFSDWLQTDVNPINGSYSLQHSSSAVAESFFSKKMDKQYLQGTQFLWEFKLRTDNWNPSSVNRFTYWLAASDSILLQASGYALGVNIKGADDYLELWRMEKGVRDSLIFHSTLKWKEGELMSFSVSYEDDDKWHFAIVGNDSEIHVESEVQSPRLSTFSSTGLYFKFTNTRAGRLWFDDWKLSTRNRAPRLNEFEIVDHGTITLLFTEPILVDTENINITSGVDLAIVDLKIDGSTLKVKFEPESHHNFRLTIDNYKDMDGMIGEDVELVFESFSMAKKGDVLINEIMYDPLPLTSEFVEIINVASTPFLLDSIFIATVKEDGSLYSPKAFTNIGAILLPENYAVAARDSISLVSNISNACVESVYNTSHLARLSNEGSTIVLLNSRNRELDRVSYSPKWHHQFIANRKGVSLERISRILPSSNSNNWASSASIPHYCTPGCRNSQTDKFEKNNLIEVTPKVISPNGDGYNDQLKISYKLEKNGYSANLIIYTHNGVEIVRLANNQLLSTSGNFYWDCKISNGSVAAPGVYLLYFELIHPLGRVEHIRRIITITGTNNE